MNSGIPSEQIHAHLSQNPQLKNLYDQLILANIPMYQNAPNSFNPEQEAIQQMYQSMNMNQVNGESMAALL